MIRNYILFITLIINILPIKMQIPNNTMEQFLDRMLHESVYDRRIRPNFKDNKPKKI